MSQIEVTKSSLGLWLYSALPAGMRVATIEDFKDSRGVERIGLDFLVHSYYSNKYEAHKAKPGVVDKFLPFIEAGRCYVKI